jgi:hypothetical protein|tara:strand:- start:342 stop:536 length:195 start_codon:yes stop_codon:yes gene_type:complete
MLGFNAISEYPISSVEDFHVPIIIQRDAKPKTWVIPERKTSWTIPTCKVDAILSKREDTWNIPS